MLAKSLQKGNVEHFTNLFVTAIWAINGNNATDLSLCNMVCTVLSFVANEVAACVPLGLVFGGVLV